MSFLSRFSVVILAASVAHAEVPATDAAKVVREVEADLTQLGSQVLAFGRMKVSRDKAVYDAQAAIRQRLDQAKARLRTVVVCEEMLHGAQVSEEALRAVARFNNVIAMARTQTATSTQGLFTDRFPALDQDEALQAALAYPGMPMGQLPAETWGPYLVFSRYLSGVAAVYNPRTCTIEVRSSYKSGVGGAYNPLTGRVEWKTSYQSGIAGAFNPKLGKVEWKSRYHAGVAAAYDVRREIVVFEASYYSGVGVIVDPATGVPVFHSEYKRGVAGYLDAGIPKFARSYKRGIALLSLQLKSPTLSSASFASDFGDDD